MAASSFSRAAERRTSPKRAFTPGTVTYGASFTKATFAYVIMQLVDEGRIDLDRSIAVYLPSRRLLRQVCRPGVRRTEAQAHLSHPARPHLGLGQLRSAGAGREAALPLEFRHAVRLLRRGDQPCPVRAGTGLGLDLGREARVDRCWAPSAYLGNGPATHLTIRPRQPPVQAWTRPIAAPRNSSWPRASAGSRPSPSDAAGLSADCSRAHA